jgi:hypothetical protein
MTDQSEALKTALKNPNLASLLSALGDGKTLTNKYGDRIAIRDGAIRFMKRDGSCTNEIISATYLFTYDDEPVTWTVDESEIDFLRSLLVIMNPKPSTDPDQRQLIHQQIWQRIKLLTAAK